MVLVHFHFQLAHICFNLYITVYMAESTRAGGLWRASKTPPKIRNCSAGVFYTFTVDIVGFAGICYCTKGYCLTLAHLPKSDIVYCHRVANKIGQNANTFRVYRNWEASSFQAFGVRARFGRERERERAPQIYFTAPTRSAYKLNYTNRCRSGRVAEWQLV